MNKTSSKRFSYFFFLPEIKPETAIPANRVLVHRKCR